MLNRYYTSIYTDGPSTVWNVIDRRSQEWIRRFPTEQQASDYAAVLNRDNELTLEDGLTTCGRCIWGKNVGYITRITRETFSIRWIDGEVTKHLRPDEDEDDQEQEAA